MVRSGRPVADVEIEELGLGTRAYNCLKRGGVRTVADVLAKDPDELWGLPRLGRSGRHDIQGKLAKLGLYLVPVTSLGLSLVRAHDAPGHEREIARWRVLRKSIDRPEGGHLESLREGLADGAPGTRAAALNGLDSVPWDESFLALLAESATSAHADVREGIASMAAQVVRWDEDRHALEFIDSFLTDDEPGIRAAAVLALSGVGIDRLAAALDDQDSGVRRAAVRSLRACVDEVDAGGSILGLEWLAERPGPWRSGRRRSAAGRCR